MANALSPTDTLINDFLWHQRKTLMQDQPASITLFGAWGNQFVLIKKSDSYIKQSMHLFLYWTGYITTDPATIHHLYQQTKTELKHVLKQRFAIKKETQTDDSLIPSPHDFSDERLKDAFAVIKQLFPILKHVLGKDQFNRIYSGLLRVEDRLRQTELQLNASTTNAVALRGLLQQEQATITHQNQQISNHASLIEFRDEYINELTTMIAEIREGLSVIERSTHEQTTRDMIRRIMPIVNESPGPSTSSLSRPTTPQSTAASISPRTPTGETPRSSPIPPCSSPDSSPRLRFFTSHLHDSLRRSAPNPDTSSEARPRTKTLDSLLSLPIAANIPRAASMVKIPSPIINTP